MKHRTKNNASSSPSKTGKHSSSGSTRSGKGKVGTKSSSSSSGGAIDLDDIPLSFPNTAVPDHDQWVPRYHAVIRRNESDGVGMEDLDTFQLEMEAMLAASVVRKNALTAELKVLNNADKYRGKNQGKNGPSSPGKRGQPSSLAGTSSSSTGHDSAKRFKSSFGKPPEQGKVIGLPKIKSDASLPTFDPLANEQIRPTVESSKPSLPKNETPNRFWSFVEPYCAPITVEDIKLLEDLITTHNDLSEYHRIPALGQHYTQRWAKEDIENERIKSSSGGNESGAEKSGDESKSLLKKTEDETPPYGELTQRLVSGLMEENLMTSVDDAIEPGSKNKNAGDAQEEKPNLIKSLNITNSEALEARVRKELEDQGILNPNDEDDVAVDNDEILDELKRCQNELKAVSAHNKKQLERLLQAAKAEMTRQELRNQLHKADQEVMDAYQKISSARSKKKPPTKKERETAWKVLKERELILQKLETFGTT